MDGRQMQLSVAVCCRNSFALAQITTKNYRERYLASDAGSNDGPAVFRTGSPMRCPSVSFLIAHGRIANIDLH
jgi:hypothetical protein